MANETTENELNQTGEPGTEYFMETLPGQDRYVAPLDETPLQDVDSVDESAPATSMWADAWRTLRRNPLFIISGLLILFIIVVAIAPGLFTKQDPNACDLGNSLSPASTGHPFGYDLQGCDVYTRVVYGTRTSLSVGVLSTLLVVIVGTLIGAVAGFFGGWVDAVLSRITDIFFALPMLLGADHRHRHHLAGLLHRGRSHAELPRRRPAHHHGELGRRHLQRADQPADRSDGAVLPVRRTGHHRARVHHDGRRRQGRPRSEEPYGLSEGSGESL